MERNTEEPAHQQGAICRVEGREFGVEGREFPSHWF